MGYNDISMSARVLISTGTEVRSSSSSRERESAGVGREGGTLTCRAVLNLGGQCLVLCRDMVIKYPFTCTLYRSTLHVDKYGLCGLYINFSSSPSYKYLRVCVYFISG